MMTLIKLLMISVVNININVKISNEIEIKNQNACLKSSRSKSEPNLVERATEAKKTTKATYYS